MENYEIVSLRQHGELLSQAAQWFHQKWGVPQEAYLESMTECVKGFRPIPQWFLARSGETLVGGLGVIENDFHCRKDLSPNICAVYVEEAHRGNGIAGQLLRLACNRMQQEGIHTLYLLTDHTSFYERYGWQFLCMVQGDGESTPSRMYVHSFKFPQI